MTASDVMGSWHWLFYDALFFTINRLLTFAFYINLLKCCLPSPEEKLPENSLLNHLKDSIIYITKSLSCLASINQRAILLNLFFPHQHYQTNHKHQSQAFVLKCSQ